MKTVVFCLLTVIGVPRLAAGEWYAWHDEHGGLHVTDQPAGTTASAQRTLTVLPYGAARPAPRAGAGEPGAPDRDPAIASPAQAELARREVRLAAREGHLQLLHTSATPVTAEQLQLENLLEDEIRTETAAIAQLRDAAEGRTGP